MAQQICQCAADTRMVCTKELGGFVCGTCGLAIPGSALLSWGKAADRALNAFRERERERREVNERDPDQAACPECAEKDAEIARLRAVLERIGGPHDCGCWQKCHCDSQAELLIWKEEAKSAANEALKDGA